MSDPAFRFEYTSGPVHIAREHGLVSVHVLNPTGTQESLRVLIENANGVQYDSFNPGADDPGRVVRAGELWSFMRGLRERNPHWVRILTTNSALIPGIQFEQLEPGTTSSLLTVYAYQSIADLTLLRIPLGGADYGPGEGSGPVIGDP